MIRVSTIVSTSSSGARGTFDAATSRDTRDYAMW